MIIYTY